MRNFFKKTPLRILILLASIFCCFVSCLLLYFFARDVDKLYSELIDNDVKARTIIQSIFTQRINNTDNIIKIESTTNADTIDSYFNKWLNQAVLIGKTFDSLQMVIPKDSVRLQQELKEVIVKRTVVILHTQKVLALEKINHTISLLDSIKADAKNYQNSISNFLNIYNQSLLNTNKKISKRTIKQSTLYLSILPIPLIVLLIVFIYTLVVFFRNISTEE